MNRVRLGPIESDHSLDPMKVKRSKVKPREAQRTPHASCLMLFVKSTGLHNVPYFFPIRLSLHV